MSFVIDTRLHFEIIACTGHVLWLKSETNQVEKEESAGKWDPARGNPLEAGMKKAKEKTRRPDLKQGTKDDFAREN